MDCKALDGSWSPEGKLQLQRIQLKSAPIFDRLWYPFGSEWWFSQVTSTHILLIVLTVDLIWFQHQISGINITIYQWVLTSYILRCIPFFELKNRNYTHNYTNALFTNSSYCLICSSRLEILKEIIFAYARLMNNRLTQINWEGFLIFCIFDPWRIWSESNNCECPTLSSPSSKFGIRNCKWDDGNKSNLCLVKVVQRHLF